MIDRNMSFFIYTMAYNGTKHLDENYAREVSMLRTSQSWKSSSTLRLLVFFLLTGTTLGVWETLFAADVQCRFKAESETTEIHIVRDGRTLWAGTIEKSETKAVSIPEGAFTVISKVYNPNLKAKGDVRSDSHTQICRDQTLIVPLFYETKEH